MPDVFTSWLDLLAFILILFGAFLIITGFEIVKIQNVSILPGRRTYAAGILIILLGGLLIVLSNGGPSTDGQLVLQPTATATAPAPETLIEIVGVNKVAEYVDIRNSGDGALSLDGWRLVSERGNQTCPLSGNIEAGETLRIWAGTSTLGGYSCGYEDFIWNNSESDPAVLYDPQGLEVSRYP